MRRSRCWILWTVVCVALVVPFVSTAKPSAGGQTFGVESPEASNETGSGVSEPGDDSGRSSTAGAPELERSPTYRSSSIVSAGSSVGSSSTAQPAVVEREARTVGFLGVSAQSLTRALREHFGAPGDVGVLISEVEPDTPASAAGMETGDVVTALDGDPVASTGALERAVVSRPGHDVAIEVYRDGEPLTLHVRLGEQEARGRASWHRGAPEAKLERGLGEDADRWQEWAEQLGQRLSEAMESQDWSAFDDSMKGFGEHWAEWGENQGEQWADWGEAQGEHWAEWGERFAQRFEDMDWEGFGDRWSAWGEDQGERWAEWGEQFGDNWAESGEGWAELGERIGDSVGSMDWEGLGEMIERVMTEVMEALREIELRPDP